MKQIKVIAFALMLMTAITSRAQSFEYHPERTDCGRVEELKQLKEAEARYGGDRIVGTVQKKLNPPVPYSVAVERANEQSFERTLVRDHGDRSPASSFSEVWTEQDGTKGTINHYVNDNGKVTTERYYPDGTVERNGVTIRQADSKTSQPTSGSRSPNSEGGGSNNNGGGGVNPDVRDAHWDGKGGKD